MRILDFHNHFYPPEYLNALRQGPSNVQITNDEEGNPCLHYPGDYNVAVRGHRDINYRIEVLTKAGVDTQVITLTTPGTHIEEPKRATELARLVNDSFAAIVRTHGKRFHALATLPLNDPAASVRELERAMDGLHLPGAMLFSNVNGNSLADERLWPLYELASDRRAVLYIHPTSPAGVEAMKEYWLMPLVGFPLDTTLAAAHLVFAGVPKRFPGIRWVLGHLGGTIPYIVERLDRGFEAFADCRRHIDRPPSEYLKDFYYDTVNFDPRALQLAIDFAGVDHILVGSDYPHLIGSLEKMLACVQRLELTAVDKTKILRQNAQELLGGTSP